MKVASELLTEPVSGHRLSAGRTTLRSGVFVFNRKFITYVLLVLYGVPTAVGSHWHSHCDHDSGISCNASECASQPLSEVTSHPCSCQLSHAFGASRCDSDNAHPIVAGDSNCDGCSICHFYASSPFAVPEVSMHDDGSLVEALPLKRHGQLRTFLQLHLARGPPAPASFI